MTDKLVTLVSQPQDYFRELITEVINTQKFSIRPETECYLVNLLNHFMKTDRLYSYDANGEIREEPLAFLVKEALEQPQLKIQISLFRHIGDISLYIAGFFQESLNRKLVDVDYYIDMGRTAYHHVAIRENTKILKLLYKELATKFSNFVEIFAAISDKTTPRTEKDILRIYELWIRTGSERAEKKLKELGILPNNHIKKDWQ